MKITALDLGVVTGVCYGEPGSAPSFTSWELRAATRAERGFKLMRSLAKHLNEYEPDAIYVEAPPNLMGMVQRGTNIDALQALYGFDMLVGVLALSTGTKLGPPIDVQQARKHFLGIRPKAGQGKSLVMDRCQMLGWTPLNTNASDAGAVWDYACALESPAVHIRTRLQQSVKAS